MHKSKKRIQLILSIFVLSSLFTILFLTDALLWLENKAYDNRIKTTAPLLPVSEKIALVLLDQESLDWAKETLQWSWPWPRKAYGTITSYFNNAKSASLAFDMIFSEPSVYGTEDDKEFALKSKEFGKVIQTVFYENSPTLKKTLPIPELKESAAIIGNVTSFLDPIDRVSRRSPLEPIAQEEFGLSISSYLVKNKKIDFKEIPHAKKGGMYIRYAKNLSDFIPYSAKDILISEYMLEKKENFPYNEDDFIPPEQFEDMHVFFGLYAPGLFDVCATPISNVYPGVGVHVCQLDTILEKKYLSDCPAFICVFLILIFCITGFYLGKSIKQVRLTSIVKRTLILFLCLTFFVIINYVLFYKGVIVPFFIPISTIIISYLTAIFENYMTEGSQRRYLKTAFKQYLSPEVIENLIENPEMLNLGGEEREITAYFSDIQDFTSISEHLTPSKLTELLNLYLSEMTDIILSYGGTIDKYEGDAIIAFWGAPTIQADHAKRAVEAAIACQEKLSKMQEQFLSITGKPFLQRIGINTGKAVVGNLGSKSRFDYTMLGDTVNLASRIEGINKQFGTYTLCSKNTMNEAILHNCNSCFQKIAIVTAQGKTNQTELFLPSQKDFFSKTEKDFFNSALEYFYEGNFQSALKEFSKINSQEKLINSYKEKCNEFIKNPPPLWDKSLHLEK